MAEQPVKLKVPLLIIIIAWILLLGGILTLLVTLPILLLGGFGQSWMILLIGLVTFIKGAGMVVVSFGLRRLKLWALYTLSVITVMAAVLSLYSYISNPTQKIDDFFDLGLQVLALVYLWSQSKRFSK